MSLFFLGSDSGHPKGFWGVQGGPLERPMGHRSTRATPRKDCQAGLAFISTLQPKAEPRPHGTEGQGCHPAPGLGWVVKALLRARGRAGVSVSTVGTEPRPTHH